MSLANSNANLFQNLVDRLINYNTSVFIRIKKVIRKYNKVKIWPLWMYSPIRPSSGSRKRRGIGPVEIKNRFFPG